MVFRDGYPRPPRPAASFVTSTCGPESTAPPLAGLTEALSTAITTALHAGAPPATFVDAFRRTRYVPAGTTSDPDVPYATSLSDYLAQRPRHDHPDMAERP
ncbi:Vitamin B12-dependent ribonucleotide reductase [Micromonospora sp. MW-13]|uniref:hypothetical protein n=1 Tax=Micromonospora sp. MW-13 TaxID=2094022 RepID=UPI000ECD2C3A|nr:hypothetical protein [Micromonospora sp. MW-13]RGC68633.1 Vitamin B12-dependent ribonucleotide reductase [Micromonospora sp. MW-13]